MSQTSKSRLMKEFETACGHDEPLALFLLLELGFVEEFPDGLKHTPLHFAASAGFVALIEELLKRHADINALTKEDPLTKVTCTPLAYACGSGQLEAARLLLDRGASMDGTGKEGRTPLMDAAHGGSAEVIELLLARGAPINARSKRNLTALHCVRRRKIYDLLVRHGAAEDVLTDGGTTARGLLVYHKAWVEKMTS